MDTTEPNIDEVQPDPGQGDVDVTGGQPYADYLTRVPEEVRGDVEPIFKDWNSNVNRRFEEHAEYKRSWEPYENVRQHQPEAVTEALQLYQAALNDPQAFQQWFEQYAAERGLTPKQAAAELEPEAMTFDQYDPNAQLQQLLDQKLSPLQSQMEQFISRQQELEQQATVQALSEQVGQEIAKLRAEHAKDLPEKVQEQLEDIIERFGMRYAGEPGATPEQVVRRAWADFESLSNQLQTGALQSKVDQPEPAVSGEVADGAPPQIRTLAEANKIALQQMRASRNA